jgi:hypothetical protein
MRSVTSLALHGMACGQAFVLGKIAQLGFSAQITGFANPARGADFSAFTDRPVAAGTTESFFYFANHDFLVRRNPGSDVDFDIVD